MPAFYGLDRTAVWCPAGTAAALPLFRSRARGLDGLRVIGREGGRHRKCARLEIMDAPPIFDPGGWFVLALDIARQDDHNVAAARPVHADPGIVFLHALDEMDLRMIERIGITRIPLHPP